LEVVQQPIDEKVQPTPVLGEETLTKQHSYKCTASSTPFPKWTSIYDKNRALLLRA
jgi:hypothetical protein